MGSIPVEASFWAFFTTAENTFTSTSNIIANMASKIGVVMNKSDISVSRRIPTATATNSYPGPRGYLFATLLYFSEKENPWSQGN